MIEETKVYKWQDLKEFCNSLTEEQLEYPVIWTGEDRGGYVSFADCMEEDYINPSGEGSEPLSAYKGEEDYEDMIDNEPRTFLKGQPVIAVDY